MLAESLCDVREGAVTKQPPLNLDNMKLILKAIKFSDFKNIQNEEILRLDKITTLIGANEAGKSNILRAIEGLEEPLTNADTKIGSTRKSNQQPPIIEYLFAPSEDFKDEINSYLKNFSNSDFLLLHTEGDSNLALSDESFNTKEMIFRNHWKNTSGEVIQFTGNVNIAALDPDQTIVGSAIKSVFLARLVKNGSLSRVSDSEVLNEFKDRSYEIMPSVELWSCEESGKEYYIPKDVPWQEFLGNPDINVPCKNLFIIAGKQNSELADFQNALRNLSGQDTEIRNYLDKVSEAINKTIKKVWKQSSLELDLIYQTDKLGIDTKEGGIRKPPDVRSEGVKWFLSFLLDFQSRAEKEQGLILLFDQPGERLHPGGQKELRHLLEDFSLQNQIIYSTQSPFLVDRNDWSKVQFIKKIDHGDSSISGPSLADVTNDELLRHSLAYSLSDVGQANDLNIVVEGYSETYLLKKWAKIINDEKIKNSEQPIIDLNHVSIFDKQGGGSICNEIQRLTQSGLQAIGLYDGDGPGLNKLKQAKKNKDLKTNFISLSDLAGDNNIQTAEDIIPETLFGEALSNCFPGKQYSKETLFNPRMENLKKWYSESFSEQWKRKVKEDFLNCVFDLFDSESNENAIFDGKELDIAEKVLHGCNSLLIKVAKGKS